MRILIQRQTAAHTQGANLHEITALNHVHTVGAVAIPAAPTGHLWELYNLTPAKARKLKVGALIDPRDGGSFHDRAMTIPLVVQNIFAPAIHGWLGQLKAELGKHPQSVLDLAFDMLYFGAYGAAIVARDSERTAAWRIAYLLQKARGASDTTNVRTFISMTAATVSSVPTSPLSWVSLDTAVDPARLPVGSTVAVVGTLPTGMTPFDFNRWSAGIT